MWWCSYNGGTNCITNQYNKIFPLFIPINNCACVSSKIPFIKNGSADDIVCELFRCTIYKGYLCFLSIDIFLRIYDDNLIILECKL